MVALFVLMLVVAIAAFATFRFPREDVRLVIKRRGAVTAVRGPGFTYQIPFLEHGVLVPVATLHVHKHLDGTPADPDDAAITISLRVTNPRLAVERGDYLGMGSQVVGESVARLGGKLPEGDRRRAFERELDDRLEGFGLSGGQVVTQ